MGVVPQVTQRLAGAARFAWLHKGGEREPRGRLLVGAFEQRTALAFGAHREQQRHVLQLGPEHFDLGPHELDVAELEQDVVAGELKPATGVVADARAYVRATQPFHS